MSIQVTFRTLKGGTFKVEAQPTDTIIELKRRVGSEQGVDDYAGYRLIYKGKILTDDQTVTSAGITPTGFVVVMPPKKAAPKPAAKPAEPKPVDATEKKDAAASSGTPMDVSKPSSTDDAKPAKPDATEAPKAGSAAPAASAPAEPSSADPASDLVTGAAYEASVKQICEMGFPEDQVKKALRAAFNNPQRAVDYLFSGIPDVAEAPPPAPATPTSTARATAPSTTAAGTPTSGAASPTTESNTQAQRSASTGAPGTPFNMFEAPRTGGQGQGSGNLDFLRHWPQFNLMRRLIQANPSVLPQLLQQLEEANPSLLALINANQVEFTRLLNEPLREGEEAAEDEVMEQLAQQMAGAGGSGTGQLGPGQVVVTEEEHEQILRLSELGATIGLEESDVVETWLACNRDETLAANFLVDHADELRADTQRNNANRSNQPDNPDSSGDGPPA